MRKRTIWIIVASVGIVAIAAVVLLLFFLTPKTGVEPTFWPNDGWRIGTPEEQGFDSVKLTAALQAIVDHGIQIDSLLLIRNGYVVLDAYFYPFDAGLMHDLASVTKSFTTTLVGIAIDQGKLSLDDTMLSFFPDRSIANVDARKESITIRDLASMRNGLQSGCMVGDEATLNAMRANEDWLQAALDREAVQDPGNNFCYDSPGMHILSGILQAVSGETEAEFARQYLFEPLNIQEYYWQPDPQGVSHGWGDLFLKPVDAARLGYLWLNGGVWDGKQIVSAEWVKAAITEYSNKGSEGYGYGWWVYDDNYAASGRNGQTIKVYPEWNLIIVVTGHGMELGEISPYLEPAFVDPENPLPANPEGVAGLKAKVAELAVGSQQVQTGPLPEIATQISGGEFVFDTNPDRISSMIFTFEGATQAHLQVTIDSTPYDWPIGLDGTYRENGQGFACRGYWVDEDMFALEIFDGMQFIFRNFTFSGESVEVTLVGTSIRYFGQLQMP